MTGQPVPNQFPDSVSVGIAEQELRSGFTPITNAWLDREDVSGEAKIIYAILCRLAWQDGHCTPDIELLYKRTKFGERAIRKALDELQALGALVVKRRGQGKSNLYIVRLLISQNLRNDVSRDDKAQSLETSFRSASYTSTGLTTTKRSSSIDPVVTSRGPVSSTGDHFEETNTGTLQQQTLNLTPASIVADAPKAGLSRDVFDSKPKRTPAVKLAGPAFAMLSDAGAAAVLDWCAKQGRDPFKLKLNPIQAKRIDDAARRHSPELMAQAATWAAEKTVKDVVSWARACDRFAESEDSNHVRGAHKSKGGDADGAAIQPGRRNSGEVRHSAQARATYAAMAAEYPDLA